jgi:hypothetical protein
MLASDGILTFRPVAIDWAEGAEEAVQASGL